MLSLKSHFLVSHEYFEVLFGEIVPVHQLINCSKFDKNPQNSSGVIEPSSFSHHGQQSESQDSMPFL